MKKQVTFLRFMLDANKKQRKLIVSSLTDEQLEVIGEIALNIYTGVFPVTKRYLSLLKPYQSHIRLLGSRDVSVKKRRHILIQQRKLIPLLFKPVVDHLKRLNG